MINMKPFLRPSVPPPEGTRSMIMFGGPLDGAVLQLAAPPDGYRDQGGSLVLWHAIRVESVPFWRWDR